MNLDLNELFQNSGDLLHFENGSTSSAAAAAADVGSSEPAPESDGYLLLTLIGFVIVDIDETEQHLRIPIRAREKVSLVSEPFNPRGEDTIAVLHKRKYRIGYVKGNAAKAVSTLIDCRAIRVEGVGPDHRYPTLESTPNSPEIQSQVVALRIFAREQDFPFVGTTLARGGLQLISVYKPSGEEGINMERVDEVFKLVDERMRMAKMVPLDPLKRAIKTELMPHQKDALGWLVDREIDPFMPPFWVVKDGFVYVNQITNFKTLIRPESIRGGIFADGMGLGKTITLLSLIAFDKYGFVEGTRYVDPFRKKPRVETKECKTTLVICPPSVLSTWMSQISEHTTCCAFSEYMYYGERTRDIELLTQFDIVLTTYSTVGGDSRVSVSPLSKIKWRRIILDEAHVMKDVDARQTLAITSLQAERRWVVTRMPLQSSSVDLFAFMTFFRYDPFCEKICWDRLIEHPLSWGDVHRGQSRLEVLLSTISLRRTKEQVVIDLPPKVIQTCILELSSEEREQYDKAEKEGQTIVQGYIADRDVLRNYSYILGLILRLRKICTHKSLWPHDLNPTLFELTNLKDVSKKPVLLEKMIASLQEGEDLECPICFSTPSPSDTIITACTHIFCKSCILLALKRVSSCCPICRSPLTKSSLFSAPPESLLHLKTISLSSKGLLLLKLLAMSKEKNPAGKSVVFSQFQKMLLWLVEPLNAAGFKVFLLDSTMDAKRRDVVIRHFNASRPDAPAVMLASLKASGTGIDLTAASTVYLLEPWWNPIVEEQAINRVHQMGQKETVRIVRIICRNTVEERVLQVQERIRNRAKEGFEKRDAKERREVNEDDVRILMAL